MVSNDWFSATLTNEIFDNEILPRGYTLIRKDRSSHGGGIMLAISNSLSYQILPTPPNLELVSIKINSIIYCLVYKPPNFPSIYL